MRKIFLDVGGHEGQTLIEVLKPYYHFDVIHCFEPMAKHYQQLQSKFGHEDRLMLHPFGLADFDGRRDLYGSNDMGEASMFSDKQDLVQATYRTSCLFKKASSFLQEHTKKHDLILMKLNCEGGEVFILRDLIASGIVHWLTHVMIDFDIRKVPSQSYQAKAIVAELKKTGFMAYTEARHAMIGHTHQERIYFWLANLPCSGDFMQLALAQKCWRFLPIALRRLWARAYKKYQRVFTKN